MISLIEHEWFSCICIKWFHQIWSSSISLNIISKKIIWLLKAVVSFLWVCVSVEQVDCLFDLSRRIVSAQVCNFQYHFLPLTLSSILNRNICPIRLRFSRKCLTFLFLTPWQQSAVFKGVGFWDAFLGRLQRPRAAPETLVVFSEAAWKVPMV